MAFFNNSNGNSPEAIVNSQINQQLQHINDRYTEMGRYVKLKLADKVEDPELKAMIDDVDRSLADLQKLNGQLLNIKGLKVCVKCGHQIPLVNAFCPDCGERQPVQQPQYQQPQQGYNPYQQPTQPVQPAQDQMAQYQRPAQPAPAPAPEPVPAPVPAPAPVPEPMPAPVSEPVREEPAAEEDPMIAPTIIAQDIVSENEEPKEEEIVSEPEPVANVPEEDSRQENVKKISDQIAQNIKNAENVPEPQRFIFCSECGHKEPADMKFCSICGSML